MRLIDITSEQETRQWLREHSRSLAGVSLQWVEPSPLIGSTVGAADVIIKSGDIKIDIELKFLRRHIRGIKFTLRPAQRKFHHSSMRKGGKTALLFVLNGIPNKLFLLRGDKIPLRDYASDPSSGCQDGKVDTWPIIGSSDGDIMRRLSAIIFDDLFWRKDM